MWKVVSPLVFSTSILGCSARGALPELSLRAMTVLHARIADDPGHRVDFACSVHLAFRPGVREREPDGAYLARDAAFSAEPIGCSDEAVCAWADAAEESVLAAMGISR
jgi:hypothetical protein